MMNALLAVVPWPYLWLVLLLALGASGAFGFVKGLHLEAERRDALDAKREASGRIIVRTINTETVRVEKVFIKRQEQRQADARAVATELTSHVSLPDPVACHLEPERVRNINAAFGLERPAADPREGDAPLSGAPAADRGLAPGSGTVGD